MTQEGDMVPQYPVLSPQPQIDAFLLAAIENALASKDIGQIALATEDARLMGTPDLPAFRQRVAKPPSVEPSE